MNYFWGYLTSARDHLLVRRHTILEMVLVQLLLLYNPCRRPTVRRDDILKIVHLQVPALPVPVVPVVPVLVLVPIPILILIRQNWAMVPVHLPRR